MVYGGSVWWQCLVIMSGLESSISKKIMPTKRPLSRAEYHSLIMRSKVLIVKFLGDKPDYHSDKRCALAGKCDINCLYQDERDQIVVFQYVTLEQGCWNRHIYTVVCQMQCVALFHCCLQNIWKDTAGKWYPVKSSLAGLNHRYRLIALHLTLTVNYKCCWL